MRFNSAFKGLNNTVIQSNFGKIFNTKSLVKLISYEIIFPYFCLFYMERVDAPGNIRKMCGCQSSSCLQASLLFLV